MRVERMKKEDIRDVSRIASENFSGLKKRAREWVKCNFRCYPRMQYFLCRCKGDVIGYILWLEKGGFRRKSVWELEQIAVRKGYRGKGVGTRLIEKSLKKVREYLKSRDSVLKLIEVTTGTSNRAQELYRKVLGARPEAVIKNLFRDDEVIMVARKTV